MSPTLRILTLAVILLLSPFLLASRPVDAGPSGWEQPTILTEDIHIDGHPSLSHAKDGKVWLAWSKYLWDESNTEIYYKTYDGNSWTSEARLTNDPSQDNSPTVLNLANGTVVIVWSSNRSGNFDIYLARIDDGANPETVNLTDDVDKARGTKHDEAPAVVETKEAVWVFWQRCTGPGCPLNGDTDIYYRQYRGGAWVSEQPAVVGSQSDSLVSAAAAKDGMIWLAWSRQQDNIFYKTNGGNGWSPEQQATSSPEADLSPNIFIARDGTVWLFWTRLYDRGKSQSDLFYATKNNGVFTPEIRLTDTQFDELQATVSHGPDRRIWVAYRTNNNPSDTWDLALTRSIQPILAHDVAISSVEHQTSRTRQGENVTLMVEVTNLGDWDETVTVTAYADIRPDVDLDGDVDVDDLMRTYLAQYGNDPQFDIDLDDDIDMSDIVEVYLSSYTDPRIPVGTVTTTLPSGTSTQLSFHWTTKMVAMRPYNLIAQVEPVANESLGNTGDNQESGGTLQVLRPEDVDLDRDIDLDDLIAVYLSIYTGDGRYDVDMDGDVDLSDLVQVHLARHTY